MATISQVSSSRKSIFDQTRETRLIDRHRVVFRVAPEAYRHIERVAYDLRKSVDRLCVEAMDEFLDRYEADLKRMETNYEPKRQYAPKSQ